jgi:hypothetical protein
LNPLDFAIWQVLQVKVQAMHHGNLDALHLSIATELDRVKVKYICKTCCSFHSRW